MSWGKNRVIGEPLATVLSVLFVCLLGYILLSHFFLEQCTDEEYRLCSVVIDGETFSNVGIRAKGNTSLIQVASYGNDRYSLKIELSLRRTRTD